MRLYKTTLTPTSNFATPLKGDTLFGQLCWALRYTFGEARLEELLLNYENTPFLVVSDGFAKGFVPKPSLPSFLLGEESDKKKENRKKVWLTLRDLENGDFCKALTNEDASCFVKTIATVKNSLNYKTFTTDDKGTFAPYSERENSISQTDIYFLIDDCFSLDELQQSLQKVSKMGYGKNSSIGKGFFEFCNFEEIKLAQSSKTFMTLSPAVLLGQDIKNSYYEPFTRFGKHGAELANTNPFKKPLLLANSGAIVIFEDVYTKAYIGKAIKGHSMHENTLHQGYAIVVATREING